MVSLDPICLSRPSVTSPYSTEHVYSPRPSTIYCGSEFLFIIITVDLNAHLGTAENATQCAGLGDFIEDIQKLQGLFSTLSVFL